MGRYTETYRGAIYPWHCDHQGHLTVMHYFGFFDHALWQFSAVIGFGPQRLKAEERGFVDVRSTIEYRAEQHVGQLLHVETALTKIGNTSLTVHHRMFNSESGELAATLETVMLYFDLKARTKLPLPEEDKARLQAFLVEA